MMFRSDSTDVMWWIIGYSRVFKPFVANRIGEIQIYYNIILTQIIGYAPIKMNPADHLTRGLTIIKLGEKTFWWKGPKFLQNSESEWPANKVCQV